MELEIKQNKTQEIIKDRKKYTAEIKIDELKEQKKELEAELTIWDEKHKEAKELSEKLWKAEQLFEKVHEERSKQEDKNTLEYIKKDDLDYIPNFYTHYQKERDEGLVCLEKGRKSFKKHVLEQLSDKAGSLKIKIRNIDNELATIKRKYQRFLLRKEGREILPCIKDYGVDNKLLGCINSEEFRYSDSDRWCENCETNYLTAFEILCKEVKIKAKELKYVFEVLDNPRDKMSIPDLEQWEANERIKYEKRAKELINFIAPLVFNNQTILFLRDCIKGKRNNVNIDFQRIWLENFVAGTQLGGKEKQLHDQGNLLFEVERGRFWKEIKDETREKQLKIIRKTFPRNNKYIE
jgi:hypothetical protein